MAENKKKQLVLCDIEYKINEIVWCKMRGYGQWPSRIIELDGNKVKVFFLGYMGAV